MKTRIMLRLFVAVLALSTAYAVPQSKPASGLDLLKTLVGEWDGKAENGKGVHASYKVVSAGSALLETLRGTEGEEMVTLYHADGNRLMLTHYCAANNQPRMRTEPVTGPTNQLTFSFVDVANVSSLEAGHMHRLVVILEDKDHFTQKWTWREKGREQTEVFHFTRAK